MTEVVLDLTGSWNLLGVYIEPADSDVETVFFDINEQITSAWKWLNNKWAVYLPGFTQEQVTAYIESKGFSKMTGISCGEGFWVNSSTAQTLTVSGAQPSNTSCSLSSGWNLIGLKSNETKLITDLISENADKIASIWKWINPPGNWAVYLPKDDSDKGLTETQKYANAKGFSVLSNIEPSEGFWVNCNEGITLD